MIASPAKYQALDSVVNEAKSIAAKSGAKVVLTENPLEAVRGAHGVYTDVCVDHAVNALLEHGRIPYVVIDAIHEIDPANAAAARERWSHLGVRTITCGELEESLDS